MRQYGSWLMLKQYVFKPAAAAFSAATEIKPFAGWVAVEGLFNAFRCLVVAWKSNTDLHIQNRALKAAASGKCALAKIRV